MADLFDIVVARKLSGGGGGGGSSDFSTATVKINYISGGSPLTVAWEVTEYIQSPNSDFTTAVVAFRYGVDAGQPVSELGTPTEMVVPIYRDYPTDIGNVLVYVTEYEESAQLNEFGTKTVVSGDAEITEDGSHILISGDCEISLE